MDNLLFSNTVPSPKRDYFIIPRSLSALCYRMEAVQHRVFFLYLQSLESIFLEMLSTMKESGKYILPSQTYAARNLADKKGLLKFRVLFNNFATASHYGRLRKFLTTLNDIRFVQLYNNEGKYGMRVFTGLFYIDLERGLGRQRTNSALLGMYLDDLDKLCSLNLGFHRQSIRVVKNAKLIYTTRLYSLAKAVSFDGSKPVSLRLEDFQTYLSLYEDGEKFLVHAQYNRYCDLKKGVLDPATAELKKLFNDGDSDIWVEVFRKDMLEGNQLPTEFIIQIHKQKENRS